MPSEIGFQPRNPRYGPFLVLAVLDTNNAQLGHFWPFLGRLSDISWSWRARKDSLFTRQWWRTWIAGNVCLRLAVMTGFRGRFGPKKAVLGHKMRSLGRAPPDLAPPPRGATGEFLAENLDLARPPPRLQDGQDEVEAGAMRRSNGQNGKEKCLLLVACLLLACCLLLVS